MNHVLCIAMPGMTEMLLVLGVVLLMFGGTRLPQLAKGLGASIREFKKGAAGMDEAPAPGEAAGLTERRLDQLDGAAAGQRAAVEATNAGR